MAETWVEQVASKLEPLARFEDGHGALFRHERFFYLAGLPGDQWLADLIKMVAHQQDLKIIELPDGVRTRRIGALHCFFNYNPFPVQLSGLENLEVLVRQSGLAAGGRSDRPRKKAALRAVYPWGENGAASSLRASLTESNFVLAKQSVSG